MASLEPALETAALAPRRPDRTLALGVFLLLLGLTLVLVVLSIPAGIYAVFSGNLSRLYDYTSLGRPYLWIGPFVAFLPFTVSVGILFAFLTAIYTLFLAYAFRQSVRPLAAVKASFSQGFSSLTTSPLLVTVIAIGFLAFSASIIDSVISTSGVPIGGPSGDPLNLLIGFTASPIVEELGFRVLLIGLIALILSSGRPLRDALGSLWRPSKAIEGLAVGSGASILIWAATGFSAVTFGACHVLCGSTWDIGKFPEAAFGGLVLGVLYVKYGFHVAVLVHWGIDYFGSVYAFFGQAAYGVPWASTTKEFVGQYLVDVDMLLLFGLASFLLVVYLCVRKVVDLRSGRMTGELDRGPTQEGRVEI